MYTEKLNDSIRITEDSEKKFRDANKQMHEMKNNHERELQERDRNIRFLAGSLEKSQKESQERGEERDDLRSRLDTAVARISELEDQVNPLKIYVNISSKLFLHNYIY